MKNKLKLAIILPAALIIILVAVLCFVLIPNKADTISLEIEDVNMVCGEVKEIDYLCSDKSAVISFESYNSKIVEIDGINLVAKKVGTTSIQVKAKGESSVAYSSFKVVVGENDLLPLTNLPSEITIYLLDKNIEEARADGYNNEMSYVRNREISSVDACNFVKVTSSKITAAKVGSGEIVFHSESGDSQIVKVNVTAIKPRILNLPTSINMKPKETFELNYTIAPNYYTGDVDVEISSNSDCLTIDENIVKAKTSGEGSISVLIGEDSYTIGVNVDSQIKYVLTAVENCRIEDNRIYVSAGEEGCFKLNLCTEEGNNIAFSSVSFASNGVEIEREVNYINFSSTNGGTITIYSSSLLSYVYLYVCVC